MEGVCHSEDCKTGFDCFLLLVHRKRFELPKFVVQLIVHCHEQPCQKDEDGSSDRKVPVDECEDIVVRVVEETWKNHHEEDSNRKHNKHNYI